MFWQFNFSQIQQGFELLETLLILLTQNSFDPPVNVSKL